MPLSPLRRFLKALGPGFVTGAADDDPSGIATYSQTGAIFGFSQLWLAPFSYPFMVAVQELCGRIGIVTGTGIAGVLRTHYSRSSVLIAIILLLVANTINIGADLGAMAAGIQLLVPLPFPLLVSGITLFTVLLIVYVPYAQYARFLKYLTLSLLAYVGVAFTVQLDWAEVFRSFVPQIIWSHAYLMNIAAFLGTTISPYLFFWQADEEVEEEVARHELNEMSVGVPAFTPDDIRSMRIDTTLGMLFSQTITVFIIVAVASTLGAAGITHIATAAEAAEALRPVAGDMAALLFTIGILGTGLLAVPVLAASVGYAIAEALRWHEGLSEKPGSAPGFYGSIVFVILAGLGVSLLPFGSIELLYWSAILNALLAPPLMIMLYRIGNSSAVMGSYTNTRVSNALLVSITAIMAGIGIALLWSLITPLG